MGDTVWAALALVLVIEGLLPFVSPRRWRATMTEAMKLSDGQLRFIGLLAIVLGLIAFAVLA